MRQLAAARFGRVSVVMIARVKPSKARGENSSDPASPGAAFRMRSTGSGTPITPVEQTTTCFARQPSSFGHTVRGGARSNHAARPNRTIRVSGIDDDGAHRVRRFAHVRARKHDRRRLHEILREHGGGRRRQHRKRSARHRASRCGRAFSGRRTRKQNETRAAGRGTMEVRSFFTRSTASLSCVILVA